MFLSSRRKLQPIPRSEQIRLSDLARAGDRDAKERLVESIAAMVKGQIGKACQKYWFLEFDEVESESWYLISRSLTKFDARKASIVTFAFRAVSWAVSRMKHEKNRSKVSGSILKDVPDHSISSYDETEWKEFNNRRVRRLIQQLPKRWGRAIKLRMAGKTDTQIGETMGISRKRAHEMCRVAILRLRSWVAPKCEVG